ncbi:DUF4372 domain-containing protein [Bacillus sp. IT-79MI2]|nr:hypothetical protein BTH41_04715 [Bacillus mycoides]
MNISIFDELQLFSKELQRKSKSRWHNYIVAFLGIQGKTKLKKMGF